MLECACAHVCKSEGRLSGVCSLPLPCVFQGSNTGHLPTEPSHQPRKSVCLAETLVYLQREGKLQFINICSRPGTRHFANPFIIIRFHREKNCFPQLFTAHLLHDFITEAHCVANAEESLVESVGGPRRQERLTGGSSPASSAPALAQL